MGRRGRGFGRRTVLQLNDFQRGETYQPGFPQQNNGGGGRPGALGGLMASYGESDEEDPEGVRDEAVTPPLMPEDAPQPMPPLYAAQKTG